MDKYYSKSFITAKAVGCLLLSPLFLLISSVLSIENVFVTIVLSVVPVGCLFTLPFWLTLNFIRKFRTSKIGKYILLDAVSCLIPAIFGVLFTEIVYTVINHSTFASGILTVILTAIFILISLIFWLLYFVFSRVK